MSAEAEAEAEVEASGGLAGLAKTDSPEWD
jgi:hypothetical protein